MASAFISYSHRDKRWLEELNLMIRPLVNEAGLSIWSDKDIVPGSDWRESIEKALKEATVAILLVSKHFLASDFIYKHELPPLLEAARKRKLQVLWVPVSDCLYEKTPIATYQSVSPTASPLAKLRGHKRDEVLKAIAKEIEKALTGNLVPHFDQEAASFQAGFAGLAGAQSWAHPLKPLRDRFSDCDSTQLAACFQRAFSRCYPGQALSSRYPDFPSGASSWELFFDYFGDGRGIDQDLLQAWEEQLDQPQASADPLPLAQVVLALVLREAEKTPTSTRYAYSTFTHQGGGASYEPAGDDGWLEIGDGEDAIDQVAEVVDRLLAGVRDWPLQPLVEIFAPLSLLEVNWLERFQVNNDWGERILLVEEAPFTIRSSDRLRMGNKLSGLKAKLGRLQSGQGQWVPPEAVLDPRRLQAIHANDRLVALRCPAPHSEARPRELWLKAVLSSMVPLALWPVKGSTLVDATFHACWSTLGLGPSEASPICPDLDALLHRRWQAHFTEPSLCQLHLFVDHPDRLPLRDVLPAKSSA
ncbi:MAG: TIR domain-containing protein [Cyanobacteriota bacterium]